jgi:aspartate ammonia-lyase
MARKRRVQSRIFQSATCGSRPKLIRALARIKKHAAITNAELGLLERKIGRCGNPRCGGNHCGQVVDQFVVDVFQTAPAPPRT